MTAMKTLSFALTFFAVIVLLLFTLGFASISYNCIIDENYSLMVATVFLFALTTLAIKMIIEVK